MKATSWKETVLRAARTFGQAFVGYIAANLVYNPANLTDSSAIKNWLTGLGIAAIAAGLAAIMNLPKAQ